MQKNAQLYNRFYGTTPSDFKVVCWRNCSARSRILGRGAPQAPTSLPHHLRPFQATNQAHPFAAHPPPVPARGRMDLAVASAWTPPRQAQPRQFPHQPSRSPGIEGLSDPSISPHRPVARRPHIRPSKRSLTVARMSGIGTNLLILETFSEKANPPWSECRQRK